MSPAARQIVSNLTGVLVQAAHPKRIILFGSQARGDAAPHSDFDIMVVEEKPTDRFAEMVRLNRLIRSFGRLAIVVAEQGLGLVRQRAHHGDLPRCVLERQYAIVLQKDHRLIRQLERQRPVPRAVQQFWIDLRVRHQVRRTS